MTANGWLQILLFLALIFAVTKPLGIFMARVFNREKTFMDPVLRPVERLLYRLTGVDENHEMRWTEYAVSMLLFSVVSMLVLYLIQRVQGFLPFNPQKFGAVNPAHLAFNTAASFTTNTNWQAYVPETTMSYLTQMAGLAYHNFVSAAVGIALAIAFIRGISRRQMETDRELPGRYGPRLSQGAAAVLHRWRAGAGVARRGANLRPYDHATLVGAQQVQSPGATAKRSSPLPPSSLVPKAQSPRKRSSRNGAQMVAGFFNANSAHPFENPTPLSI
jgi:K+-transporting ATPase ATPase A chain